MVNPPDEELFLKGTPLKGRFRSYTIKERIGVSPHSRSSTDSTTSLSETTTSIPHLRRHKTQVFIAKIDKTEKQAIIKAILSSGRDVLEDEEKAFETLSNWAIFPFMPRPAPRLIEKLREHNNLPLGTKTWYFAVEMLDPKKWVSLRSIIEQEPLASRRDAARVISQFRRAFFNAIHWLHLQNIVHGDIKDEHVFVRKQGDDFDFTQIRIIDFGNVYLNDVTQWRKIGSLGFSTPSLWREAKGTSLADNKLKGSMDWLKGMDWYGAYAVLYYACTGACFPIASSAYSILCSNENKSDYFEHLNKSLEKHNQRFNMFNSETLREILNETVKVLSHPDVDIDKPQVFHPPWWSTIFDKPLWISMLVVFISVVTLLSLPLKVFFTALIAVFGISTLAKNGTEQRELKKLLIMSIALTMHLFALWITLERVPGMLRLAVILASLPGILGIPALFLRNTSNYARATGLLSLTGPLAFPSFVYPMIFLFPGLFYRRHSVFAFLGAIALTFWLSILGDHQYLPGWPVGILNHSPLAIASTILIWSFAWGISRFYSNRKDGQSIRRLVAGLLAVGLVFLWPVVLGFFMFLPLHVVHVDEFALSAFAGMGMVLLLLMNWLQDQAKRKRRAEFQWSDDDEGNDLEDSDDSDEEDR